MKANKDLSSKCKRSGNKLKLNICVLLVPDSSLKLEKLRLFCTRLFQVRRWARF